jgi:hypothetical protein
MVYMVKLVDEKQPVLPPASTNIPERSTPATKKDIEELGDKLVWPPAFTRDSRLKKMQNVLDEEDRVMKDTTLSDTEKVLRVAELKQQYSVHDNELFSAKRLGAVPTKPLPTTVPLNEPADDEDEDDSDVSSETDAEVEEEYDEESEIDDSEDDLEDTLTYTPQELVQNVKTHRRAKTRAMLKKLALDGKIKWDGQGNVYYKEKQIPQANISQLVGYFQTAHKQKHLPSPPGKKVFGQALRNAHAMEDVLLGGQQDDSIRTIFKGHTPKTPRFRPRRQSTTAASSPPRPIKRKRLDDSKIVRDWEH